MKESVYNTFVNCDPQEQDLLRQLIRGDIAGYEVLFHKYYPTFFAFIKGMTKETAVAEDIAQNIFMKVWLNREKAGCGQIHPQLPFRAGQTRDIQLLPHQEPHVHDPKGGYRADRKQGGGNLPSRNEIEEKLDLAETAEQVEIIVGKMPPQRQQIFRMSRFEHMPSREIAEQLNLSVRTVDKHLELALKELRKYLNIIPAIIVFLDILP